jgi:hypothetical protein
LPISYHYAGECQYDGIKSWHAFAGNYQVYPVDYRDLLAALIQRGVERDEFRPVDAQSVAITIASLYEGLVLLWMVDPQAVQWENASEKSLNFLLEGLQNHQVG